MDGAASAKCHSGGFCTSRIDLVLKEKDPINSFKTHMTKHSQSIDTQVTRRIKGHGSGWVFTPRHFYDLGSRSAIDLALHRMKTSGAIRQLARGLYDYPRQHPKLGLLNPPAETVAKALANRDSTRLQPAGGYAANLLGLSDQIPMNVVFLTDGPTRSVSLGRQTITLKKTTPKNMATAGKTSGLVIQALRHLGQRHVDESTVNTLRQRLSDNDKQQLLKDLIHAPAWAADIMRQIATPNQP
jgi:hypothetical protein